MQWESARLRRRSRRRRRPRRQCGGTSTSARCPAAAVTRTASPTTSSPRSPLRGTSAPSQSLPTATPPGSPRPSWQRSPPPASASTTSPPVQYRQTLPLLLSALCRLVEFALLIESLSPDDWQGAKTPVRRGCLSTCCSGHSTILHRATTCLSQAIRISLISFTDLG